MSEPTVAETFAKQGTDWATWFRAVRRRSRRSRTKWLGSWEHSQFIMAHSEAIPDPERERADHARILGAMNHLAELVDYLDTELRADPAYVPPPAVFGDLRARLRAVLDLHPALQPLVLPA